MKKIPSIHQPIQRPDGSMEYVWYLFLQWVSENAGAADLSDYFTKEETEALLAVKANTDDLSDVAFTGDYDDLLNKPTIPAPQVNSDWNATSGVAEILNKPTIGDAIITITQGGVAKGSFSLNQSTEDTIDLDAGGITTGQSIDAEIVGRLTVADNGDVSGFTNSNYMTYPGNLYMTDASSFEMVFAFTTSSYSTGGNIISCEVVYEHQIYLGISGHSLLWLRVNSGMQQISATGTTTLAGNTKYYVKVVYNGTNYTMYLSTDGSDWNNEATMTATYLPGVVSKPYRLGRSGGHGIRTIHMSECYVKKDDILVWQGMDAPGLHQRVAQSELPGLLIPDYSQGQNVALTGITQWIAPIDCFVSYQSGLQNTAVTELKIGNKRVAYFSNPFSGFVYTTVTFYMKAGQILTGLSDNDINRDCGLTYYPLGA